MEGCFMFQWGWGSFSDGGALFLSEVGGAGWQAPHAEGTDFAAVP